jgi:hypothetical protein
VLVVTTVATKVEVAKSLILDGVTYSGGGIMALPYEDWRMLVACFTCGRFGYRARGCM